MPRKVSKNTTGSARQRTYEDTIRVEKEGFFSQVKAIYHDPRTSVVCGVVMLAFAVFAAVAMISFFLCGTDDASLLSLPHAERIANHGSAHNWLGLPGARLAAFMVDGMFGLMSIALIVMLFVYGMRLVQNSKKGSWKFFFCTVFWIVWGSVLLSFLQTQLHINLFFHLGGVHGEWLNSALTGYVRPVGTILIMFAILVIYMVVTDMHLTDGERRLIERCKQLFTRKKKDTDLLPVTPETTETTDSSTSPVSPDEPENPIFVVSSDQPDDHIIVVEPAVPAVPAVPEVPAAPEDLEPQVTAEPIATPETPLDISEPAHVELGEQDPEALLRAQGPYDPRKDLEHYRFPTLDLLKVYDNETAPIIDKQEQQANANKIVTTLRNFGIEIEQIKATVGPTVTLYEVVPKAGTRIAKIQSLESDIMLSLSAIGIRIIAPMPGKGTIGIEVPNEKKQVVSMHSVVASKRFQEDTKMHLPIALGRTITNEVFMFDLAKTPHLLVAGATGQGKSVAINAIITSLLYKKHPSEMKLVLVDPKRVEFVPYRSLMYHYLAAMPGVDDKDIIITDCQKVIDTLNSLVIEMENRYELLEDAGVRNLEDYNEKFINRRLNPDKLVAGKFHHQFLPYIVIIIDEYGDFIMQAGKQVETPIARITQKARAVGMHMILATQRPSVNIVTGVIKANIPTRIALRTQSVVDSRTVLDAKGADHLIGKGDLLYSGGGEMTRVQCAFVDTPEVDKIVEHVSEQQHFFEPYRLPEYIPEGQEGEALQPGAVDMKRLDPMFADVARYVVNKQEGSTSRLQRAFEIGYNRAGKLSDQLEAAGIVGPNKGPKGRDVLIQDPNQLEELLATLNC